MRKWPWISILFLGACAQGPIRTAHTSPKAEIPPPVMTPRAAVPKGSPEAHLAAGQKAFQARDFARAFDLFISAAQSWKDSPKELEAQFWGARAAVRLGRWSETLALTETLLKYPNWLPAQKAEAVNYRIRALEAVGDNTRLLATLLAEMQDPKLAHEAESYRLKAREVVESRLSQGELEPFLDSSAPNDLRASAAYRLGEIALEAKDLSNAQSYFKKAESLGGDTETGRRAAEVLSQLETLNKVEPKTVGVVLPLTGKHAPIAQKTLRGIQMGLGLYGKNISSFKLAVVDDEANPDRARQGVERLVKEDNVIAVIGSLLSKTASGVASKSSELGVPSLALSQKSGITDIGPTVHRNSLTSEMQVRWLVKQAEELGMKRFAVLYPNDAYGVEFTNIFWDEVLARGGQITAAQVYSPKETDFRFAVQRLVGTYYVDARVDEYRLRAKELKDAQKTKSVRQEESENILPPIIDFDAIFIPDSAKALGQIAAMLSFNDVKGVKLLGTNLWNVPGVQKRAGNWSKDLLFVDSFVSADPGFQNSSFVRDYKAIFGEEPGIFELQGYDSALILRQLISQGYSSRDSLNQALGNLRDIPGALSRLSMGPDREIQRPLVALTLENGQIVPFRKKTTP
jgi:ABC-type branched-subunit amino acid transport system substrate-binding protein